MRCCHDKVIILRANAESPLGLEYKGLEAFVDELKCLNFIKCTKCGSILDASGTNEKIFGEDLTEYYRQRDAEIERGL